MQMNLKSFSLLAITLAWTLQLTACGGGDDVDTSPIMMSKSVTRISCQPSTSTLLQVDQELDSAGVKSFSRRCASGGQPFPAICGVPISYLRVVEISKFQEPIAKNLGYFPLEGDVRFHQCPEE